MEHSRREETGQFPKPWKGESAGLSMVGTCVWSLLTWRGGGGTEGGTAACRHPVGVVGLDVTPNVTKGTPRLRQECCPPLGDQVGLDKEQVS